MNDLDKQDNWAAKMRARKPPSVGLDWRPDNTLNLSLSGDWARIFKASGNVSVSNGLMAQAAILGSQGKRTDQEATNFVTGYVDAMAPQDAAEALLLTQMAATHQATLMLARRRNDAETLPQQDAAERALNKLARTYAAQMETLKRYRSKGQQTVRVERVNVESGGQAIVGNVETGGACRRTG
ncbi:YjbH domain-containing protein [Jannaschia pohangensis]|uniref:YjbH domain-containing protein n=1 Tax=Jannaschia pohangensis TaxID=390807 RepID=UPI0011143348|nr:YjbH domain-containing protein [Jannaschia pohangensis]